MIERLKVLITRAPGSPDLMIALVLVLTIAMMILPMPLLLVDLLIGFNLGFAVLLLMVSLYVRSTLEFSTLPGIILLSTVFRLALTITTTRLILIQGDAGEIIRTFGEFVVAGSVIVGLVIFLIITLVQFIVVAKGAERVAEVAARFILDALPGKQMAIDAELRNGDIDQIEARRRRSRLEQESQLYGAMDGAMKFVKGDAIAGLVIIAVNLIGGVSIGMVNRGQSLGEAVREYSLLTVGDALIAQIPALLLSITAATVVTRVTGESKLDLGRDIASQLAGDRRALRLAAVVLLAMGLVPGFPTAVFLVLAIAFSAASLVARGKTEEGNGAAMDGQRQQKSAGGQAAHVSVAASPAAPTEESPVVLCLAPALHVECSMTDLARHLDAARTQVSERLGVLPPVVGVAVDPTLADFRYRIDVEGVPVEEGDGRPAQLLLQDDLANVELLGLPYETESEGVIGIHKPRIWIPSEHATALAGAGIGYYGCGQMLGAQVCAVLSRNAARFIGIQETKALLAGIEGRYGDLVKEVLRVTPVQRIADVLRRLVDEGVSIRNARLVLEALAEWGEKESSVILLTEYVRAALKRQICHCYANAHRVVAAYMIERATEDVVRGAVRDTAVGPYLVLEEQASERLLDKLREIAEATVSERNRPVILCSMDVRRFVRGFLVRNGLDLPVLSYQELAGDFTTQPVGSIGIGGGVGPKKQASRTQTAQRPPVPAAG